MGETPDSYRAPDGEQTSAGPEPTVTFPAQPQAAEPPAAVPPAAPNPASAIADRAFTDQAPADPAATAPAAVHPGYPGQSYLPPPAHLPPPGSPAPNYQPANYQSAGYQQAAYPVGYQQYPGFPPPGVGLGGPVLDAFGNPLPPPMPPTPKRKRKMVPAAAAAALVLVAAAAGAGIGHVAWHSPANQSGTVGGSSQSQFPGSQGGDGSGNGNGSGQNGFGFGNGEGGSGNGDGSNGDSSGTTEGSGGPSNVSAIAQAVSPALVDVNSVFGDQSAEGAGTGIVLTSTGEILTNNHVINGATSISVTDIGNGKTYTATVVGYSDSNDVAVLQLQNASGLTTAKIGDSSKATAGAPVVAIGNAGGTGGTPTSAGGSVTAVNQSITASDSLDGVNEQLSGLLQVNADVQEGDSGGSLVNTSDQVVGMDTAASSSYSLDSSGGQGYAIPINQAMSIAKEITSGQSSSTVHIGATAFLGVLISTSGSEGGSGAGGDSGSSQSGAQVSSVVSGGSAQQAGLASGDVITSLNGRNVDSSSTLSSIMAGLKPGQSVEIGWTDTAGQTHQTKITLGTGPSA
jgi:S1-C subfamily serine protease